MQAEQFAREVEAAYQDASFSFHCVSFADKVILNVVINGVADTSFDIPLSTHSTINTALRDEEALGVEPVVLVGDPNNIKLLVVASQIGKVVAQLANPRNVILTIGLRWFGREAVKGDFERLMFVLENVKKVLSPE